MIGSEWQPRCQDECRIYEQPKQICEQINPGAYQEMKNCDSYISKVFLLSVLAGQFLWTSCSTAPRPAGSIPTASDGSTSSGPDDHTLAVIWFQQAAEARALYYQAFNIAGDRLAEAIANKSPDDRLAVIVDIDETVLDNSPYQAYLIKHDRSYTPASWKDWTDQSAAGALPGAQQFLATAVSNHVAVFYISNRGTNEFDSTSRNLIAQGFPKVDLDHLLLQASHEGKEPNRMKVAKDYKIVLLMGDQLGDFSTIFDRGNYAGRSEQVDALRNEFGRKFIALPNPMYGRWEDGLYQGKQLNEKQKAEFRRELLRSFE